MHRLLTLLVLCFALLHSAARAQPLPVDPALATGELDNGLRYVVLKHSNPPGRAMFWLRIDAGSLNETDRQRGIAHFLEHMAFNGSENFAPGTVMPFFESLGMTFGQHQNAFTSFNQTVYQLSLPDVKPETIDKGLLFLSDVAFRLTLPEEEIENERQVILEEKRTRESGMQRVGDKFFEEIAPGSLLSQRMVIGTVETIRTMTQQDFRDFYDRWYVPSAMTLIAVADAEPATVIEAVKARFSGGERKPAPAQPDPGVRPSQNLRALVLHDPELSDCDISINWSLPAVPPVTTVEALRRDLVEQVGAFAFNRRMRERVAEGKATFLSASAFNGDFARAIRWRGVSAGGRPEQWGAMLDEIAGELQRARLHGFTEKELERVRAETLANAEHAAQTERTAPAGARIGSINSSLAERVPHMSAAQSLELFRSLLPGITAAEVSALFAEQFNPENVTFAVQMPSSASVPTEADLLTAGVKALTAEPEALAEAQRADSFMETPPTGGEVVELSEHAAAEVGHAWLSNGVRLHHRYMDARKDEATISITLAGGGIEETAENRGITQAAALAWGRSKATARLTSTEVTDLLGPLKASVGGRAGQDTLTLSVSGSPADFEPAMQLAHLLLTEPRIEGPALDNWKTTQRQLIAANRKQPEGIFGELLWDTILPPGEVRQRMLTEEQVDRVTREEAQAWLDGIIRRAPIEVAIVGDIDRERAFELARVYLGSLPARERIGSATLDHLRTIDRPAGPLLGERQAATETKKTIVLVGFFNTDQDNVRDRRLMDVAAKVITTRMVKRIREAEQLVYSIQASSGAGQVYPGYGMFSAFGQTDPEKTAALRAAIREMYDEFGAHGPSEEEVSVARSQILNMLQERRHNPGYWLGQISDLDYRGLSLDDTMAEPTAYDGLTPGEVQEAFKRYDLPERRVEVVFQPAAGAGAAEAKPEKSGE